MKTHLNPKPILIAERFKFHQRNQQEDETISTYLAELRRLTEHCDFGNYREKALRDRFVCGLVNEAIQKRLLTELDMKLSKAHELAVGMDIASREAKDMKNRGPEACRGTTRKTVLPLWELRTCARKMSVQIPEVSQMWKAGTYCESLHKLQSKAVPKRKVWKRISLKWIY